MDTPRYVQLSAGVGTPAGVCGWRVGPVEPAPAALRVTMASRLALGLTHSRNARGGSLLWKNWSTTALYKSRYSASPPPKIHLCRAIQLLSPFDMTQLLSAVGEKRVKVLNQEKCLDCDVAQE